MDEYTKLKRDYLIRWFWEHHPDIMQFTFDMYIDEMNGGRFNG